MAAELPTAVLLRRMADLSARGEQVDPTVLRAAADELGRTARAWQDALAVIDEQGEAVELLRRAYLRLEFEGESELEESIAQLLERINRPHEQEAQ